MSANLDFVKAVFARWARGDFSSSDWADPEIEFAFVDGPNPGRAKGLAGMEALWRTMLNAWVDLRAVPDEFRELDEERVLVFLRNEGRGRTSGIDVSEISVKSANLFEIRAGKVTRLLLYWDRDNALADLGLPPESGSSDA
jgi:ketosteroid isomerase-like protein